MKAVEIDHNSGFCYGVRKSIEKIEEELINNNDDLYCLGDIIHNTLEMDRLRRMGLKIIEHDELRRVCNKKVLFRTHGEPPSTYEIANQNNIHVIDTTCPTILRLKKKFK
jgi:4-hydroxy-3-methylbut-2-enyl diphosphate reductase